MKLKFVNKVITSVLMVAMTVTTISFDTCDLSAAVMKDKEMIDIEEESQKGEEPKVVRELEELRTKNSTTYLLSDGSRKLEISGMNIRYEEDGKLIDYNPNLNKASGEDQGKLREIAKKSGIIAERDISNYKYSNIAGDSKQYFPKELDGGHGILLEKSDIVIEFSPAIDKEVNKQNDTLFAEDEQEFFVASKSITEEDCVIYTEEENNINLKYKSYPNGVKEEIILNEKPKTNIFEFDINSPNARLEKAEGSDKVYIIDAKTNEVIAYIEEPNVKESGGNPTYEEVTYKLKENEKGQYTLKVIVDEGYLNSDKICYPLTIDPTVIWMDSYLKSATVSNFEYTKDRNMLNGSNFLVQNKAMTRIPYTNTEYLCYINTMGSPLSGSMDAFEGSYVESANLKIVEYIPDSSTYSPGTIEVRTPNGSWNPDTITWNNHPGMGNKVWAEFTCTGQSTRHDVDLTEWAQALADGDAANYGLILKAKEQGTGAYFYGSSLSNLSYMQLSIVYSPYTFTVNSYYDWAFVARYVEAGNAAVKIKEETDFANQVFQKVLGVHIFNNTPTLIISLADNCKLRRGIGVSSATINEKCPGHAGTKVICTHVGLVYSDFMSRYLPNSQSASVLWTGNALFNEAGQNANRSFRSKNNGILMAEINWGVDEYYDRMKGCLVHELAHTFGATDYYHEKDADGNCLHSEYCIECHPETGRPKFCIMCEGWPEDITTRNPHQLFCEGCIQDMKNHLESLK